MKYILIIALTISAHANAYKKHDCVYKELVDEGYVNLKRINDPLLREKAINGTKGIFNTMSDSGLETYSWSVLEVDKDNWVVRGSKCHLGEAGGVTLKYNEKVINLKEGDTSIDIVQPSENSLDKQL